MIGDDALAAEVWDLGPTAPGGGAIPPELVGLKAHNLIRMAQAGLPVPPGFVLSTGLCRRYHREGRQAVADAAALARREISALEVHTGRNFGGARRPLLVSVRSGAAVSMPGMLETILNVGLNEASVRGLIRLAGDPRFAWDCFRRFIQQFAPACAKGSPADRAPMLRPPRHPGLWTAWTSVARPRCPQPQQPHPSLRFSSSIKLLLAVPVSTMSCPQKPGAAHFLLSGRRAFDDRLAPVFNAVPRSGAFDFLITHLSQPAGMWYKS